MARKRSSNKEKSDFIPAASPEDREKQMISLAVDLAERQLRDGSASNQVIVHYLKLATQREKLEEKKLQMESEMISAKKDAIAKSNQSEELVDKAIEAFKSYSGN